MQTLALGTAAIVEIISTYTATNQQIPAAVSAPAWYVVGAFYMARTSTVKLEAIGLVSLNGDVLTARIFDVDAAAEVSGSLTPDITDTTDERALSGSFEIEGGKVYQMQAQCIGAGGYAMMRSASLA